MYVDAPASFSSPHILTPSLSDHSNFALGDGALFATGTAGVTSIVVDPKNAEDRKYLLGLLNSRLLSFYIVRHSPPFSGGYFKFSAPYLKDVPIRPISLDNRRDKSRHGSIISLVDQMLSLLDRRASTKSDLAKAALERQITATDRQIDELVYELYELTPEEIKIVEEATA
jgi:hypothetical protein